MKSLIFVTILTIVGIGNAQDACQTESACVFQISNGHYIDLTALTEITQSNDNAGKDVFQFNPCNAFNCSDTDDALACDKRFVSTSVLIPKGSNPTCTKQGDDVTLQYTEANTVLTVVLKCTTAMENSLQYESGSPVDNNYKFVLTSPYACDNATIATATPTGTATTASTGTTKTTATTGTTKTTATTGTTQSTTGSTSKTGTTQTTSKTGSTMTTSNTGSTKTTVNTSSTKTTSNTGTTKTTVSTGSTKTTNSQTTRTTPQTTHGNASKNSATSFLSLTAITLFITRVLKV